MTSSSVQAPLVVDEEAADGAIGAVQRAAASPPPAATAPVALHLHAMLAKKVLESKRDKKYLFSGIVFPILAVVIVIVATLLSDPSPPGSVSLSPSKILNGDDEDVSDAVVPVLRVDNSKPFSTFVMGNASSYGSFPAYESFDTAGFRTWALDDNRTDEYALGGIIFDSFRPAEEGSPAVIEATIMYNTSSVLTLPVFMSWVGEAMYRVVTAQPSATFQQAEQVLSVSDGINYSFAFYGPFLLEYGFVFLIPFFSLKLVEEREKHLKHLLLMNSLPRWVYWFTYFVCDVLLFFIPITIGLVLLFASRIHVFVVNTAIAPIMVFVPFALVGVCAGYLLSFPFDRVETAGKWVYSSVAIFTLVPYLVVTVIFAGDVPAWVNYLLCIFPPYCLYQAIWVLTESAYFGDPLTITSVFYPSNQIIVLCLIMLVEAVLALVGIIFLDFGLERLRAAFSRYSCELEPDTSTCDEDVLQERARVLDMATHPHSAISEDVVMLRDVIKEFSSSKVAVRGVSIGIEESQCFGLLGPNGAGKTTLLGMVTGALKASAGSISLYGYDISDAPDHLFRYLGFCPQENCLFDLLTVREHLVLFARIKGLRREECSAAVDDLIARMDLGEHEHKLSTTLSGGNKRKLCVSIAFLGDPKIVFLDEPSTGMDPVTRRKLWELIASFKEGRAIVLTTHSMEEADALCEKIGIMVLGQLRCLGSSQHLKGQYGSNYNLSIKTALECVDELTSFILDLFPDAIRKSCMSGTMVFEVPSSDLALGRVFGSIEANRKRLQIADYSLSQPTLEQVFLRFAAEQELADAEAARGTAAPS